MGRIFRPENFVFGQVENNYFFYDDVVVDDDDDDDDDDVDVDNDGGDVEVRDEVKPPCLGRGWKQLGEGFLHRRGRLGGGHH